MATYQGPQRPGYGFTETGGSARLPQGPLRPGEVRTPTGFEYKQGYGSGGASPSPTPTSTPLSSPAPKTPAEIGQATNIIKQGATESQAAYNARLESLGRAAQASYQERLMGKNVTDRITKEQYNQLIYKQPGEIQAIDQPSQVQQLARQTSFKNLQSIGKTSFDRGTVQGYPKTQGMKISNEPYIEKRVTGEYTESQGQKIPEVKFVYVEPRGKSLGEGITQSTERTATQEEIKSFKQVEGALTSETTKSPGYITRTLKESGLPSVYENVKLNLGEYQRTNVQGTTTILSQAIQSVEKRTGLNLPSTLQEARANIAYTSQEFSKLGLPKSFIKTGEFISYVDISLIEDLRSQPLKYATLYGISAGAGLGIEAGVAGAGRLGSTYGSIAKLTTTGTGVYLAGTYTLDAGSRLYLAEGVEAKASVLADVSLETVSVIGGFKLGQTAYGKLSVIGKEYVPIEELVPKDVLKGEKTFVESSSYGFKGGDIIDKQTFDLKIFQEKGYGYHTTPEKFWTGEIKVSSGTSEFEGLYIAPDVSIYFAKSGGGKYNLFPSFEELISYKKPAIAKITPKDFDIQKVSYSDKPVFEGQAKVNERYSYFKETNINIGTVTGVKPEIEAVLPKDSSFIKEGKTKYTTFKGKNILIDEFKYVDESIASESKSLMTGKQISSSYGEFKKEALVYPESSLSSRRYKTSSYGKTSYKISNGYSDISSSSYSDRSSFISSLNFGRSSFKPSIKSDTPSYISKTYKSVSTYYRPRTTRIPDVPKITIYPSTKEDKSLKSDLGNQKGKKGLKQIPLYNIQIRRRGKFRTEATGLTRGEALARGSDITTRDLSRTFSLKQSGFKETGISGIDDNNLIPNENVFRTYKIRQGKKIYQPNVFIQRQRFALSSPGERIAISEARRNRKLTSGLLD